MLTHVLHQRAHHLPHGTIQRLTITLKAILAAIAMDAIEHLSENVQLLLLRRPVPDPYGTRIAIAAQVRQLLLGQVALAANAVHNLQVFAVCAGEALQPVREGAHLLGVTKCAERVEREGGIAQPGIAVIPVAHPAQLFGERRGGRGDNGARCTHAAYGPW